MNSSDTSCATQASGGAGNLLLQALLDKSADMITITDRTGHIVYANAATEKVSGYPIDEFVGRDPFETIHPEDRPTCEAVLAALQTTPGLTIDLHHRILHKDGTWRWVAGTFTSSFDDPVVKGLIATVRDVTEQKRMEAELQERQARYQTLFASIDEGFCIVEMLWDANHEPIDYRFLEANPLFEQMTGLHDVIGQTARTLVPNLEDFWINTYGRVAQTGEPVRFEQQSEAMQRWFDVYAARFGEAMAGRVAIVFTDTTERRRLIVAEQEARAAAEASVQIRDQFLSIAAHELRTPLTALLGYTSLLAKQVESHCANGQISHSIERVTGQAYRLNGMLNTLLDVSRIQHGQLTVKLQPLDLRTLLEHVVDAARMTLHLSQEHHPIELWTEAEPVWVMGDPVRLDEVFTNLLSNAMKYSLPTQPVHVQVTREPGEVVVAVRDQGIGIPAHAQQHLFMPFYRAGNVAPGTNGFGIGLYVVREIIVQHGGRIEVASQEGQGSTFRVILPRVLSH